MTSTPGEPKHSSPEAKPLPWPSIRSGLEGNADWTRDLIEHSQDLLCVHDLQGRFLSVNPVPARLLGYTVEEILRIPMRDLIDPNFRDQFDAYLREIERAGEAHGALAVITRTGERRFWEYHNTLRTQGVETPVVRGIAHDITDRVHAERALREANKKLMENAHAQEKTMRELKLFRAQLDESNDAILVIHPETLRFLDVNERVCARLGYSREELLTMTVFDIDPIIDNKLVARLMHQLGESGFATMETVHRRKDGTTFPAEVNMRRVQLDREYGVAISRDITERKVRDQALAKSEAELREAQRVANMGSWRLDLKTQAVTGSEQMLRMMGLDSTQRALPFSELGKFFLPESWQQVVEANQRVLHTNRPEELEVACRRPDGTTGWLLVRAETETDAANNMTGLHGIALDITGRRQAEAALRKSEERLRLAQEAAHIGAFERNFQTGESQWTPQMEALFGLAPGGFPRTIDEFLNLIHPDDREQVAQWITQSMESGEAKGEWRVTWPDGTVHWISGRWRVFKDASGKPERAIGVDLDITERRHAEEGMRYREAELKEAQRVARMGGWRVDVVSGEITCSEELYKMIGHDGTHKVSSFHGIQRFLTPGSWDVLQKAYHQVLDTRQPGRGVEVEFRRPDGTTGWVILRGALDRDAVGNVIGMHGGAFDITGSKLSEQALRESEERLRLAQVVAKMGTFERNLQTGTSRWMPELEKMYGLPPGGFPKTIEAFLDLVHPEDRAKVERCVEESLRTGEGNGEWRVVWPDRTVHWITGRWRVFRDQDGRPVRAIGIDYDITDRKRAEEAVRASEAELRESQRVAHMGSWRLNLNTLALTWSEQIYRELGLDDSQLLPSSFHGLNQLLTPESWTLVTQAVERIKRTGLAEEIEVEFRRADGAAGCALVRGEVDWDERGNIVGLHGIALDITERRRTEEALRTSEERLRVALKNAPIRVFNQDLELRYTWAHNLPEGCADQDFLGKTDEEVFGAVEGTRLRVLKQGVLESGQGRREEFALTVQGTTSYCDVTAEPLQEASGKVAGVSMACMDITGLRKITEQLQEAKERLTEEKLYLEQEIDTELGFEDIIGRSKALKAVMESAGKVATSDATVLLLGETGTGKELVARAIHRLGRRAGNAFIKMNCAAIPSGLLESELFGNEKGAFTGAVSRKIGRLELADKGTIFLDEVGEISLALQPKLLRVLQDQEFERLGGTRTLKVNFRLIAATNRNLGECVRENEFRSDLYYRLNVFPILLPPLRDRREDIPLLVEHFVQKCARRMNKLITSIPKRTMDALTGWSWPGNVRELENFIERSVLLTNGSVLAAPLTELRPGDEDTARDETLKSKEREHILRALRESHGQISGARGAAARLGLKRTTLQSKLKSLGINPRIPVPGSP